MSAVRVTLARNEPAAPQMLLRARFDLIHGVINGVLDGGEGLQVRLEQRDQLLAGREVLGDREAADVEARLARTIAVQYPSSSKRFTHFSTTTRS